MALDDDILFDMHRRMLRIRLFEEAAGRLFEGARMPGFIHLYVGQEAVAAGVCAALRPEDQISSTHRGHGHLVAKGGDLNKMMAELMGMILRVRDFLDAHHALVATAMGALVALIIGLTRRLRAREMETLTLLGCRKRLQWSMQAAELAIVLGIAFLGAWSLTALTIYGASSYFRTLIG